MPNDPTLCPQMANLLFLFLNLEFAQKNGPNILKKALLLLMLRVLNTPIQHNIKAMMQEKKSRVKRHIALKTQGLPHTIAVI